MLTNAISEAIFESSGFAHAAVELIYAFLARKAGYWRLTRNIPHRIHWRLMIDASSRLDAFFSTCSGIIMGPVAIDAISRPRNSCSFRAVKVNPVMPALWNQVINDNCPLSRRSIDLLENPSRKNSALCEY